nr:MAG TPA: hypothetical protein [Caudoviricetes sp.]
MLFVFIIQNNILYIDKLLYLFYNITMIND